MVRLRGPGLSLFRVPSTKRSKDNFQPTKIVPYLQAGYAALFLALVLGRPQCCDTLLRDLAEFSQMTLLCAGFALGRAVS